MGSQTPTSEPSHRGSRHDSMQRTLIGRCESWRGLTASGVYAGAGGFSHAIGAPVRAASARR